MMYELVRMKFGSHVYGTATEKSDTDYKGIFIPPAIDLIYGNPIETISDHTKKDNTQKNTNQDVDLEYYSLKKYMKLLLEGQTVAIDMFFTPDEFHESCTPIWKDIQRMAPDWLHKSITPFVGYCMRQASKYGVKGSRVAAARKAKDFFEGYARHNSQMKLNVIWDELQRGFKDLEHCEFLEVKMTQEPNRTVRMFSCCDRKVQEHVTVKNAYELYSRVFDQYGQRALQAETNENVDWKAMSHAVRIADQAIELLNTGKITFPRKNADHLLKIKKGMLDYKYVADELEELLKALHTAQEHSALPNEPNYLWGKTLVTANYTNYIITNIIPGFNQYEKVDSFINRGCGLAGRHSGLQQ